MNDRHASAWTLGPGFLRGALVAVCASASGLAATAGCVGDDPAAQPGATDAGTNQDGTRPAETDSGGGPATQDGSVSTDAGTNTDASDAPVRFCATQSPATGVADFFCADFDGSQVNEGFTRVVGSDAGTLTQSTAGFFSPPASLTPSNSAGLLWEKTGPTAFSEVNLEFRLNVGVLGGVAAPQSGSVKIAELSSLDTNVGLFFTRGGTVSGSPYTGYYVVATSCPSACGLTQQKITTAMPTNVWTKINLTWTSDGLVIVTYNDVEVLNKSAFSSTSTKITATIGLVESSDPPLMPYHGFDNVIVQVKRK